MIRWFALLGFGWVAWAGVAPPRLAPDWQGQAVTEAPQQTATDRSTSWQRGAYAFQPLARFAVRAVVLARNDYDDAEAEFCPTDLALGWSWMSEAALIARTDVTYRLRRIDVQWPANSPVGLSELLRSCTNLHAIPANDEVRRQLGAVRRYETVELSGYLVTVSHPDGREWKSSVTRDDTGMGACEIMWIEGLTHGPVASGR